MPTRLSQLLTLFLVVAGSLSAAWVVRPAWMEKAGLDWWSLAELQWQMAATARHDAELDWKDQVVLERIEIKEQIIEELLAERLTLLEAAAWFRHLNAEPAEYPAPDPRYFPGNTEEERYCRQVLKWAAVRADDWAPSQREMMLCRLEAELESHLAEHDGRVELPNL